jgi:RNase P subunit RPR2
MQGETNGAVTSNTDESSIFRPEVTRRKLEELVSSAGLPEWLIVGRDGKARACAQCNSPLSWSSIRSVTMCLNAQHFGDVQVEVLCQSCYSAYLLHFRKACHDARGVRVAARFCSLILGDDPGVDPVRMSEIPPSSNNLADAIIDEASGAAGADTTTEDSGAGRSEWKTAEDKPCQS